MLETIRHVTTMHGKPVTLEVSQLPAVQALRLLNKLSGILAGGLAGLTGGKLQWLTDADFEHVQRALLARVTVRDEHGKPATYDFDAFMTYASGEVEVVLELVWAALQGNYPKSFSKARAALSNPASLTKALETLMSKLPSPRSVRAVAAPNAPAKAPSPSSTLQTSKASAF